LTYFAPERQNVLVFHITTAKASVNLRFLNKPIGWYLRDALSDWRGHL